MAQNLLGVTPVASSQVTTPHDTTGDLAPHLHIDHTYYQEAKEVQGETHQALAGRIQVSNQGQPLLEDIFVYLHIVGDADFSDPYICDVNGNPIPPGPGSRYPAIYFGDLSTGQTSPALTYYWTLVRGFSATEPSPFQVTPILIPKFTVNYDFPTDQAFKTDTTTVAV